MKISKLFHWLYALLMLLPAFFVGGRMAYTIFNKNAKDSYSGAYATDTKIYINDIDELVYNENYYFTNPLLNEPTSSTLTIALNVNNLVNLTNNTNLSNIHVLRFVFQSNGVNSLQLRENLSGTNEYTYLLYNSIISFNFDYVSVLENPANYNLIENCIYTLMYQGNTLDNAFSYSVSQLNENVLFSWAKDSFIVQPFTYITGLFGMPSDSPVLTLLSYWCSISLIWLTFDLLMYVPLLVHRWLDKGVLE